MVRRRYGELSGVDLAPIEEKLTIQEPILIPRNAKYLRLGEIEKEKKRKENKIKEERERERERKGP